jgi:hypothetical protein
MAEMVKINRELLFETISNVAESIEKELTVEFKKGIFFVPELHFAFEVGKALYRSRMEVFGVDKIDWLRETNLGNGGPSDLVFQAGEEFIVFEFKIAGTSHAYQKDIEKLQRLSEKGRFQGYRFFVALIDRFWGKPDARIDYLESLKTPILLRNSFKVGYSGYKGEIFCTVAFLEVSNSTF